MIIYPHINPIAFHIGPLPVHWYGLMYILGFFCAWGLCELRAKRPNSGWKKDEVSDLIFFGALGVVLGGRTGYELFYNFPDFITHPWVIFKVWDGGMSFHGGLMGVLLTLWLYGRKIHKSLFELTDFVAPVVPLGLAAGRIGNFINGELWGRVTTVPWGMVFPTGGPLPRHPSQIYEFLMEGVLLFLILWIYSSKPRPCMAVSGLFALLYGLFRIIGECFRQPDPQLGFIAFGWLTMGQLLSVPLVIIGISLLVLAYRKKRTISPQNA
jgi:phosphatidylglycerol:prolipoprotein diacylglycerol transferase